MSEAMREECHANSLFEQFILGSSKNTQLQQAFYRNAVRQCMDIFPLDAISQFCDTLILHLQNNLIYLACLRHEFPWQREDTSDISAVRAVLTTSIDEYIVFALLGDGVHKDIVIF